MAINPNWAVTEVRYSPNFTAGRSKRLEYILIHWWGAFGQSHDGVVSYLCRANGNTSAHYVVSAGRVTQIVSDNDTAWHCPGANANGVGIECRPEMSEGDFDTAARLIAAIWSEHGYLPLRGHRDFYATQCPGNYYGRLTELEARAREFANAGGASVPVPATQTTTTNTATSSDIAHMMKGNDMFWISTARGDGSWARVIITEHMGAIPVDDANEVGAYVKMFGHDAPGLPWDWFWLLIRQAWERNATFRAAVGKEVDEGVDEIVERMKVELGGVKEGA